MSTLILPLKSISNKSTMAWVRICYFINKNIKNVYIADSDSNYKKLSKYKFKNIIIPYQTRTSYRDIIKFLKFNNQSNLYWLINEYNEHFESKNVFSSEFVNRGFNVISNTYYDSYKFKNELINLKNWHYINLNVSATRTYYNCFKDIDYIYWGRYRDGRKEYFKRYLDTNKLLLSTSLHKSKNNLEGFKELKLNCKFADKVKLSDNINLISRSLNTIYIEDKYTHNNYNSLSDRFYESVSLQCLPFFDINCMNTINESKYNIHKDLIVTNLDSLLEKMNYFNSNLDLRNNILSTINNKINLEKITVLNELETLLNG